MLKPIYILGTTASGKSKLAIEYAEHLMARGQLAEIVSADAYQIYKDLPILTAAPTASDLGRVRHHLIHELELNETNDAAKHARKAEACIADIQGRGGQAIVTGGSGLYVKFITHGISEAPPSDESLRAELEACSSEELVERFQKLDPKGLAVTAVDNKRYLVRNLEIVLLSGLKLAEWRKNWVREARGEGYLIERAGEEIEKRIEARAKEMVIGGVIEEVARIEGRALSATAEKTLGLRWVRAYIRGEIGQGELEERLRIETRQYAKRQRTWLRREGWLKDSKNLYAPL